MKMSKFQVTVVAILATLTVAVLCGIGFVVYSTMTRSYGDPISQPVVHQPVATPQPAVPTATPIPTWTPKPLPMSTPTPDVKAEIEVYLDELDPLLDGRYELHDDWDAMYNRITWGWCTSNWQTLQPEFHALEQQQDEIDNKIINLVPPKQLRHAHELLVSSIRHRAKSRHYVIAGCVEINPSLWDAADIEGAQATEDWQAAFDEIREVLNKLDIEREDREEQEEDLEQEA